MGELRMSVKERGRLAVLARVQEDEITLVEAAELLDLSYRQTKRVWKRYRVEGDKGLVHRARGHPSARRIADKKRAAMLALYRSQYADFGPTLAAEQLAKRDHHRVDHETLRRWLMAEGLWQPRRVRQQHRQWRERKQHCGELVQIDGSEHAWFERRAPRAVLMVMIDDATNRTYARFYEGETTAAAFDVFGRYYDLYGLPQALYPDQDSIYQVNTPPSAESGQSALTQFGRAMKQLGVGLRPAHSPQAKGRVERRHQLFQDRLVKELRLAKINDLARANRFLEETFLPELNARFTVAPVQPQDRHRKLPRGVRLAEVLCWEETRVVARDWTISWNGGWWQIDKRHTGLSLVGREVVVRRLGDGRQQLLYRNEKLTWRALPARPQSMVVSRPAIITPKKSSIPKPDHPWRQYEKVARKKLLRNRGARAGSTLPPAPPARAPATAASVVHA